MLKLDQLKKEYEEIISNLKKDKEDLKIYYENKLKEYEEEINKNKNEILKYKEIIEKYKKEITSYIANINQLNENLKRSLSNLIFLFFIVTAKRLFAEVTALHSISTPNFSFTIFLNVSIF